MFDFLYSHFAYDCRPDETHHTFSVAALTGVLQRSAQRRKGVREEKAAEKVPVPAPTEKKISTVGVQHQQSQLGQQQVGQGEGQDAQQLSRSNSVMSMAPSMLQQQSSSTMISK